jgi:hypothetical protein
MPDLTVVCAWWGGWPDEGWGPEYVRRLRDSVARWCSHDHRFVCATDNPDAVKAVGVDAEYLYPISRENMIPKLTAAYAPHMPWQKRTSGRVIVMDLDTVIVRPVDDMFAYVGDFACRGAIFEHGINRYHGIGGDMIAFPSGFGVREIWEPMVHDTGRFLRITENADERAVYREYLLGAGKSIDFWQDLFPGQYISFKADIRGARKRRPPRGTRLVSFHGRPRQHEVLEKYGFVREHWRRDDDR